MRERSAAVIFQMFLIPLYFGRAFHSVSFPVVAKLLDMYCVHSPLRFFFHPFRHVWQMHASLPFLPIAMSARWEMTRPSVDSDLLMLPYVSATV